MKKRWILLCALLVVSAACAVRIAVVNHADWIEEYAANTVIYEEGAEVSLPGEYYYLFGYQGLSGYYMRVEKTELVPLSSLLEQYGLSYDELAARSGSWEWVDERDAVFIVTASFGNRDFAGNGRYQIDFRYFPLVGEDYVITPATDTVGGIPAFNEEQNGRSFFGIKSDRVVTLRIPYLIDVATKSAISADDLLSSPPRLLIGYYPDEVYLELPAPEILE